ncbi:hypothetical protein BJ944DRAFT_258684 [Cunninghamella echinulata]|nr:hypothetical protein BJ944DRAFT_258684 [Cunninghamella echinulata]
MTGEQPIIIIGSGLSGLVLAHALKKYQIPYMIYEKDQGIHSRKQESSLTLHQSWYQLSKIFSSGSLLSLIETANVNPEETNNLSMVIVDGSTNTILESLETNGPKHQHQKNLESISTVPMVAHRLNHHRLRQWLIQGLDIQWGYEFDHVVQQQQNKDNVQVHFKNGHVAQGKLVIGADGTRSKVCQELVGGSDAFNQITTHHPAYMLTCKRWLTENQYNEIRQIVKLHGFIFGYPVANQNNNDNGDGDEIKYPEYPLNLLFVVLNDVNREISPEAPYQVCWMISKYEQDMNTLTKADRYLTDHDRLQLAKSWVEGRFQDPFQSLVLDTPDDAIVSKINLWERLVPIDHLSKQSSVTLIGDACHSMVPSQGAGGNQGIVDAVTLADQLKNVYHPSVDYPSTSLAEALSNYHQDTYSRTTPIVESSSILYTNSFKSPEFFVQQIKKIKQMISQKH